MRVISKKQPITFDRAEAEEKADIGVMGIHAMQTTAKLASKGDYSKARAYNYSHKAVLERAAKSEEQQQQYSAWASKGRAFESEIQSVQTKEKKEGLFLDDEDAVMEEEEVEEKKKEKAEKRGKARKNNRSDTTANMLYKFKNLNDLNKE